MVDLSASRGTYILPMLSVAGCCGVHLVQARELSLLMAAWPSQLTSTYAVCQVMPGLLLLHT